MNRILFACASTVSVLCAAREWQLHLLVDLAIFDVLMVTFILLFVVDYLAYRRRLPLARPLRDFLVLQWGWVLIVALTGFSVLLLSSELDSRTQYLIGLTEVSTRTAFFTCLLLFMQRISTAQRSRLIQFFVAGVLLSCVYELVQVIAIAGFGVNVDAVVWNALSVNSYRQPAEFIERYAWAGFYRGTGIAGGPNPQAFYIATVLPLFLLHAVHERRRWYVLPLLLTVVAFAITQSRSGAVALAVTLLTLVALDAKRLGRYSVLFGVVALLLVVASQPYWDAIEALFRLRMTTDVTRLEWYDQTLSIVGMYPMGVGYNNFSVVYEQLFGVANHNAHNSWLQILVETGVPGVLLHLTFFGYIIWHAGRRRTILSRAFVSVVVGMSVGAFFNQTFDLFFIQFYLALFFGALIVGEQPLANTVLQRAAHGPVPVVTEPRSA